MQPEDLDYSIRRLVESIYGDVIAQWGSPICT